MKMRHLYIILIAAALFVPLQVAALVETVSSPNHIVTVNFDVKDGVPVYDVSFKGRQIIPESRLGLELSSAKGSGKGTNFNNKVSMGQNSLCDGFTLLTAMYSSTDETWTPVWGEESSIRNNYNEMAVTLLQEDMDRYIIVPL